MIGGCLQKANSIPHVWGYFRGLGPGKLWRLKYRIDGREKLLAIGAYPEIGLSDHVIRMAWP